MTVGELAKKMGVTVRTLQHYDKEGFFSPSAESDSGRRLYTDKDLIKLYQILSLKHLGFSLEDIKNRIISLDTPTDVAHVLTEQAADIKGKIQSLLKAHEEIELLKTEVLQIQSVFTVVSSSIGCILGLIVKKQAKLTMVSQIIFLPSIMLSGIMFPIDLLPNAFELAGNISRCMGIPANVG